MKNTYLGILFDDEKHTYDDFGMRIKSINIGFPEVKKSLISLPGTSNYVDMTDYFGTRYETRIIKITGDIEDKGYDKWSARISDIANFLHGKKRKLVLDWDSGFYYVGRCAFEPEKKNRIYGEIELEFECDPYKYEITSSDEDWPWDPFDLENGIIREYKDISINGQTEVIVIGSTMTVVPKITASVAMTVTYLGETYNILPGDNYFPELEILDGEHAMFFEGSGTVTISYRGGSL